MGSLEVQFLKKVASLTFALTVKLTFQAVNKNVNYKLRLPEGTFLGSIRALLNKIFLLSFFWERLDKRKPFTFM